MRSEIQTSEGGIDRNVMNDAVLIEALHVVRDIVVELIHVFADRIPQKNQSGH